jgi:hypothetical protein
MNRYSQSLAVLTVAMLAQAAAAHHSFAMFDASKTTTVAGTIKKFQWTNPHSWIYLTVTDGKGQPEDWPIELGAPSGLARQGWTPRTLQPGMTVKVTVRPLKNGMPGGQFLSVTLPDGRELASVELPE